MSIATAAVTPYGGTTATAASSKSGSSELGQDTFLKLMLTQMKNQDPFKPQDPTAFVSQLAQFSTVNGVQGMQRDIASLVDALRTSQLMDGTALVGRDVLTASDSAVLQETGAVKGAVDVPEGATEVVLAVTDASGQLVRRMPLSSQAGTVGFSWDGTTDLGQRAPPGLYQINAIANRGGNAEQLQTQLAARVGSVTLDPSTQALTLNTDLGPVAFAAVRRVM
ncbi:MAG: hypothetical protein RL026_2161 [Pseudomonadota bacterium]|jgi:flagellar basal-body rod modification protein FlgD